MFAVLKAHYGAAELKEVRRQHRKRGTLGISVDGKGISNLPLGSTTKEEPSNGRWSRARRPKRWSANADGIHGRIRKSRGSFSPIPNSDVAALNEAIRNLRLERGDLASTVVETKYGSVEFAPRDRIQFTGTDKRKGIYNGQAGTILRIECMAITVVMDGMLPVLVEGHWPIHSDLSELRDTIATRMWILVVEDEPQMARILCKGLQQENHTVTIAANGTEAVESASSMTFDAVILDVMLPDINGLAVSQRLRAAGNHVPILMLTARDSPEDIIKGLDAGADDYLVKPFGLGVLQARLRALSRRASSPAISVLQVNDLILNPATREVSRAGKTVSLTATEFRFLEHLMRRAGRVASRSSIIDAVWGFQQDVENNTVDNYIRVLREKIDPDPATRLIHTVRGYGYVLRERA
jgi:DNA-binding response OmpR family regulator